MWLRVWVGASVQVNLLVRYQPRVIRCDSIKRGTRVHNLLNTEHLGRPREIGKNIKQALNLTIKKSRDKWCGMIWRAKVKIPPPPISILKRSSGKF